MFDYNINNKALYINQYLIIEIYKLTNNYQDDIKKK